MRKKAVHEARICTTAEIWFHKALHDAYESLTLLCIICTEHARFQISEHSEAHHQPARVVFTEGHDHNIPPDSTLRYGSTEFVIMASSFALDPSAC